MKKIFALLLIAALCLTAACAAAEAAAADYYTIRYYEDEAKGPSNITTVVKWGTATPTKTIAELGFSEADRMFDGWKVFRTCDDKWMMKDPDGKMKWETLGKDGSLPAGYSWYIYGEGWNAPTIEKSGEVSFYAQWTGTTFTVTDADFGANGSDTKADDAAIQKALNNAKRISGTTTVKIPAGTYYLDEALNIFSDTKLILESGAKLVRNHANKAMLVNVSVNKDKPGGYNRTSNIVIQGGTWDGNAQSGDTRCNVMRIFHAKNVTVSGLTMKNCCSEHFIEFVAVSNVKVKNCTFRDYYYYKGYSSETAFKRSSEAVQFDFAKSENAAGAEPYDDYGCVDMEVSGCKFINCLSGVGNHHVETKKQSSLKILNNTFTGIKNTCINLSGMSNVTISGNSGTNVGRFIHSDSAQNVEVSGNGTVEGRSKTAEKQEAFYITLSNGITITGSGTFKGFVYGIYASKTKNLKVSKSKFSTVTHSGISIDKNTEGTLTGNEVSNCDDRGITVRGDSSVTIDGNTVKKVGTTGIVVTAFTGDIINNTISVCGEYNIRTYGTCKGIIKNNTYDLPYGILNNGGMTRKTNIYAKADKEPTAFTVFYHLNDKAEASKKTTKVEYGTATKTLTIAELGFSSGERAFLGWKAYRNDIRSWRVVDDATGKTTWQETLEKGKSYSLFKDGCTFSTNAPAGAEVHLYAVWEGQDEPEKPSAGGALLKLDKTKKTASVTGLEKETATKVTIPATYTAADGTVYKITEIAAGAFKGSAKLQTAAIGANVAKIGKNAFSGCAKLKKVTGMEGLTEIGDAAFQNCVKMTSFTVTAGVKKIGKKAFSGCAKLKTITIKSTKLTTKTVGKNAFKGIYAKAKIKCPKAKKKAYEKFLKKKGLPKNAKVK